MGKGGLRINRSFGMGFNVMERKYLELDKGNVCAS
jgi:hypothetical protein